MINNQNEEIILKNRLDDLNEIISNLINENNSRNYYRLSSLYEEINYVEEKLSFIQYQQSHNILIKKKNI